MAQNTPPLILYRGRTNVIPVSIGYDVSGDEITCQIRVEKSRSSDLILEPEFSFLTDGVDGEGLLTIDDSEIDEVSHSSGWMDLKRISGGEPLPLFDGFIEVLIRDSVTV